MSANTQTEGPPMSGEDFRLERLRFRLSQWQVARMSGVNPSRISRYENEVYEPTPSEQRALRAALNKVREVTPA